MAAKLYIGGLSYSTTSEGLREYFDQCGNVLSATVITDRFSGQSRGFGFVEMESNEEANNAISQLNGRELDGRRITVEISNPQAPRSGGGGGGRGRPGGGGRAAVGVGVAAGARAVAGAQAVAAGAKAVTRIARPSPSAGKSSDFELTSKGSPLPASPSFVYMILS